MRPGARSVLLFAATWVLGAACTATAVPPSTGGPTDMPSAAVSAAPTRTPRPTPSPSPTTLVSTAFTGDDERIATAIRAGVAEAIPVLGSLRDMDPSQQERLFEPVGTWINEQEAAVERYTPSSCTVAAVELFLDGLDQYDHIRALFLAWRDWGANGNAYPPGAPREAAATLAAAVDELDAQCAG